MHISTAAATAACLMLGSMGGGHLKIVGNFRSIDPRF